MKYIKCLEADSIELAYGERKILQSIYLKMPFGEVTAILGRNGCGKSSLLQIIFGTLKPVFKSVRWDGRFVEFPYREHHLVRYLPQQPLKPPNLRVQEAFKWYDSLADDSFGERWQVVKNKRFGELSGGESRFWETLLILFSPVQYVLLDEPFSHLSPIYVEELKLLITSQKAQKGILITDHLFRDVLDIADQTYFLQNGTTYLLTNPLRDLMDRGYIPE